MRVLQRWCRRVGNFVARRRGDARLREEMASHLASQTEENLRAGMTRAEACRQARLKFGAVETVRDDYHAEEGLPWLEDLLADVRYALRVLRKSPAFTVVVALTLLLGVGANVVVFGVLNAVLLHPLDVADPAGLYQLRLQPWRQGRLLTTSYPAFEDFRRRNATFRGMAGFYGYSRARLSWSDGVRQVAGYLATGDYFDLLGVQPEVGRFFHAADEHGPDSAPYVVLSDRLWRSLFHADPGVVGTTVDLDRHPFTVVGVAPARFHGTEQFVWPDYWVPMVNAAQVEGRDYLHDRTVVAVTVLGRLKPGVTPRQAAENLDAVAAGLAREYPETDQALPWRLIHPGLYGDDGDVVRGFLYGVSGLALLVLAAACANLASLFAARAADRGRELALRAALGASRGRLARQLMTEATVVSLVGGAAGLATAGLLLGVLNRWQSPYGHLAVGLDARVFLAALALTLTSAGVCGIAPARQLWQRRPGPVATSGSVVSPRWRRLAARDLLLGAQIVICTLLVVASLAAARGLARVLRAPWGFRPEGALLAEVDLSQAGPGGSAASARVKAMIEAVRSIPGVTAAGTASRLPMTGGLHGVPVFRPGTTEFKLSDAALVPYVYTVSPAYLETAGTHLLGGRDFSWHDTAETPDVGIVNQTFARRMWGETSVVGQRFIVFGHLTEVVGVVEDGKYHDLLEPPQPVVYLPSTQGEPGEVAFVVRSARPPNETAAALARTLGGLAPEEPLVVRSWWDALGAEVFPARAATVALGVMGLLAAMLAVTGLFGMAAYNVSRRTRELGIRAALGAPKTHVVSAAVGRPMGLLGTGSLVGLLLSVSVSRVLGQVVYQADPRDPVILAGAALTMVLLGSAASAVPALRALAVDPAKTMREE